MRKAGKVAGNVEMSEGSHAACVVSGFTAINLPRPSAPDGSIRPNARITSKATKEGRGTAVPDPPTRQKKRRASASSIDASLKKPRNVRLAEHSCENGTSKNDQETESSWEFPCSVSGQNNQDFDESISFPGNSLASKLPVIRGESFQDDVEAVSTTWGTSDMTLFTNNRRPGLAEKYQVAYGARLLASRIESSQSFQVSSDTEFEPASDFAGDDLRREKNASVRRITREMHEHAIAGQMYETLCPSPRDFELPPSAHLPRASREEPLAAAVLEEHCLVKCDFSSDNHEFYDDWHEGADEFSELMQGDEPVVQEKSRTSGGTSEDHEFEDVFDGWPDDLSLPDAVTIYDHDFREENDGEPTSCCSGSMPILTDISSNILRPTQTQPKSSRGSENGICASTGSDFKSSLINSMPPPKPQQPSTPQTSPHRSSSPKLQWLPPKTFTPMKSNFAFPVRPVLPPHLVPIDGTGKQIPFVRVPFPKPLLDRSPIAGLSNATVLRTCFRTGEALNAAAQAWRSKVDVVIELFARVATSSRDSNGGYKQYFQFADLFTGRSPHLDGTSAIWKGVGLWDQDSKVFTGVAGRGKMCRVIGRIKKREDPPDGCEMTVISIWEVDWEDVGIAKGVVCS